MQNRNNLPDKNDSLVDSIKILSEITRRDIKKINNTHPIKSNNSSFKGWIFRKQKQ